MPYFSAPSPEGRLVSSDFPQSAQEADDQLERIRQQRESGIQDKNTEDLMATLELISKELYHDSTHFLHELVQNADDNQYGGCTPTLRVQYNNRHLLLLSNEMGFCKKNVDAICSVGRSSKRAEQTIGEKGVGFKSVFRAADKVWITSGHYSFSFDSSRRLGIITPRREPFPQPAFAKHGHTAMCLRLAKNYDSMELVDAIKKLDPRLLMFLRKLRCLELSVTEESGHSWSSRLQREEATFGGGLEYCNLLRDGTCQRYVLARHQVTGLDSASRRLPCTESELVLAFAISEDARPLPSPQEVHAFLPIRDCGLKFLLHGDFQLTASRQDIDISSRWNQSLLYAIPHAILSAVQRFNESPMAYRWPQFLREATSLSGFLAHVGRMLVDVLSRHPILISYDKSLSKPKDLFFIADAFLDSQGKPLLACDATSHRYLSPHYAPLDRSILLRLGVRQQPADDFLSDLELLLERCPDYLWHQSADWHSSLSSALISIISESPHRSRGRIQRISKMRLVQLRNGQRVAFSEKRLILASQQEELKIPQGLDILEIDLGMGENQARRDLVRMLGAQDATAQLVYEAIDRTHSHPSFTPSSLPVDHLISHALYCYRATRYVSFANVPPLWFWTEDETYARGKELYLRSSEQYSAASWPDAFVDKVRFLHGKYRVGDGDGSREWTHWLVKRQGLHVVPPLVSTTEDGLFCLSDDFRRLMKVAPSSRVLEFLKHQWHHYSDWIGEGDERHGKGTKWEESRTRFVADMAMFRVSCLDGATAPLKSTLLPVKRLTETSLSLRNLLDVPKPDDPGWGFLRHFGVKAAFDTRDILRRLREMCKSSVTLDHASQIYTELMACDPMDWETIREAFSLDMLIYIPSTTPAVGEGAWVTPDRCVWDGHFALQKTTCLERHYPKLGRFFQGILQIEGGGITTLMLEATQISLGDDLAYIAELLGAISTKLRDSPESGENRVIKDLASRRVFPVQLSSSSGYDELRGCSSDDRWYIADRPQLRQSFEGHIGLLAFDPKQTRNVAELLQFLGAHNRFLSRFATSVVDISGTVRRDDRYSIRLRERAYILASLVRGANGQGKDQIISAMNSVDVFEAERVTTRYSVKLPDGAETISPASTGRVKVVYGNSQISIYLAKKDLRSPQPPLELTEELSKLLGIEDTSQSLLLHVVFSEPDTAALVEMLEQRGIAIDTPECHQPKPVGCDAEHTPYGNSLCHHDDDELRDQGGCDRMRSFIAELGHLRSVEGVMDRAWMATQTDRMLSKACRLDNQDPFLFLPMDAVIGYRETGLGLPDEETSWSFQSFRDGGLDWKKRHPETDVLLDALYLPRTRTVFISSKNVRHVTEEIAFLGEYAFSKVLELLLGSDYRPDKNWTSILRTKAGYPYYERTDEWTSAFTIDDSKGHFTKQLRRLGFQNEYWKKHVTFHIDVVTTEEKLKEAEFYLSAEQLKKAQLYSCLRKPSSSTFVDVSALVRISSIQEDPEISLFVDPWKMIAEGNALLLNGAHYGVKFADQVPWHIDLSSRFGDALSKPGGMRHRVRNLLDSWSFKAQSGKALSSQLQYEYCQLAFFQIRLLVLYPGKENEQLEGEIIQVSLHNPRKYIALSYHWGRTLKETHGLQTTKGLIEITKSLHLALQNLRNADREITVWADAICINQDSSDEKKLQIRLMREIFEQAQYVVAWTGAETQSSTRAMKALQDIRIRELEAGASSVPKPSVLGKNCPDAQTEGIWEDIRAFFEQPWFSRAWIVQEIVFATRISVRCGSCHCDWDELFEALQICVRERPDLLDDDKHPRPGPGQTRVAAYSLGLLRKAYLVRHMQNRYTLLQLFELCSYTHATKKRDKLFSLLSLASDASDCIFDPDYTSPLEDVLFRYAEAFVQKGHVLSLLYHAGTSKSRSPLSSWIPNWTSSSSISSPYPPTISTWRTRNGPFCAASQHHSEPHASVSPDNHRVLVVRGARIDRVKYVGDASRLDKDVLEYVGAVYADIGAHVSSSSGGPYANAKMDELRFRVPTGNALHLHPPDPIKASSSYHVLFQAAGGGGDGGGGREEEHDKEDAGQLREADVGAVVIESVSQFLEFMDQPVGRRQAVWDYLRTASEFSMRLSAARFCTTQRGFVGLVPHNTAVGDSVVVFDGGTVPFVVRAKEKCDVANPATLVGDGDMAKLVTLVGECYIHGIMHGEAEELEGAERGNIHLV